MYAIGATVQNSSVTFSILWYQAGKNKDSNCLFKRHFHVSSCNEIKQTSIHNVVKDINQGIKICSCFPVAQNFHAASNVSFSTLLTCLTTYHSILMCCFQISTTQTSQIFRYGHSTLSKCTCSCLNSHLPERQFTRMRKYTGLAF